ncbi:MAG: hypothetical protein QM713_06215 [Arachnia sp.]
MTMLPSGDSWFVEYRPPRWTGVLASYYEVVDGGLSRSVSFTGDGMVHVSSSGEHVGPTYLWGEGPDSLSFFLEGTLFGEYRDLLTREEFEAVWSRGREAARRTWVVSTHPEAVWADRADTFVYLRHGLVGVLEEIPARRIDDEKMEVCASSFYTTTVYPGQWVVLADSEGLPVVKEVIRRDSLNASWIAAGFDEAGLDKLECVAQLRNFGAVVEMDARSDRVAWAVRITSARPPIHTLSERIVSATRKAGYAV